MRRSPVLGFILALLCIVCSAAAAHAGDASPGKLLYAKKSAAFGNAGAGSHWRSEFNFAAPLDASVSFDLDGCVRIGPNPCLGVTIPKGGAKTFDSDFVRDWIAGPDIGVINAPTGLWAASSFLEFSDGVHRTAFTAPVLRWVLGSQLDDFRAGTAARTSDKTTCSTFYADSETGTAVQVRAYGADGQPAKTVDGDVAPVDVYFLSPQSAFQGCLADWYSPDGKTLYAKGATFSAGTVRVSFGCGGVGPCPGPQRTWFIVTKGPLTGATIETLFVQEVGPVEATSASVRAEAAADGDLRGVLVHLHGAAPAALVEDVERHNADVERMRTQAR